MAPAEIVDAPANSTAEVDHAPCVRLLKLAEDQLVDILCGLASILGRRTSHRTSNGLVSTPVTQFQKSSRVAVVVTADIRSWIQHWASVW